MINGKNSKNYPTTAILSSCQTKFSYFCAMNKTCLFILVLLILIGCFACKSNANYKKSDILPLDTVAVIVADCFFLEGEIHAKHWKYSAQDYSLVKYDSFFEKHGITKEVYVQNVRYYFLNKKYAEKIMSKVDELVEQRVSALRDSLN